MPGKMRAAIAASDYPLTFREITSVVGGVSSGSMLSAFRAKNSAAKGEFSHESQGATDGTQSSAGRKRSSVVEPN